MRQRYCCIGLGNPGKKYQGTRHNIGFEWVDRVVQTYSFSPSSLSKTFESEAFEAEIDGKEVFCLKPQTYMNLSGQALRAWKKKFPGQSRVLVVYDDLDLELGRIRYRESGSDGGHRGIRSLIECGGTRDLPRLRLGVGPAPVDQEAADFVLAKFSPQEKLKVGQILDVAPEHFRHWLEVEDSEALMNVLNSWRVDQ